MKIKILFVVLLLATSLVGNEQFYYQNNQKIYLHPIENNLATRNISNIKYFKTKDNIKLGVIDEILLKIYEDKNIESIIKQYNLVLLKKVIPKVYLVKVLSKIQTIDISNQLHNDIRIKYANPNFLKEVKKR